MRKFWMLLFGLLLSGCGLSSSKSTCLSEIEACGVTMIPCFVDCNVTACVNLMPAASVAEQNKAVHHQAQ